MEEVWRVINSHGECLASSWIRSHRQYSYITTLIQPSSPSQRWKRLSFSLADLSTNHPYLLQILNKCSNCKFECCMFTQIQSCKSYIFCECSLSPTCNLSSLPLLSPPRHLFQMRQTQAAGEVLLSPVGWRLWS